MTKDEIIRMAQEAGWSVRGGFVMPTHAGHITHELERFAKLVEERTLKQLNTEETV